MSRAKHALRTSWAAYALLGYAVALGLVVRASAYLRLLRFDRLVVDLSLLGLAVMLSAMILSLATSDSLVPAARRVCLVGSVVLLGYMGVWWLAFHAGVRLLQQRGWRGAATVPFVLVFLVPSVRGALARAFAWTSEAVGRGRMRAAAVLLAALTVSLTLGARRHQGVSGSTGARELAGAPNIVLVLLDEWSADHSSLPGLPSERLTTPGLSELARHGTVFSRAYATSLFTHGSLKAVWTATPFIRSHSSAFAPLPRSVTEASLLEKATAAGYQIGYVFSLPDAAPESFGFRDDGWEVEALVPCRWAGGAVDLAWLCLTVGARMGLELDLVAPPWRAFAAAEHALRRLQARPPFLLFVHVLAPHRPYRIAQADSRQAGAVSDRRDEYDDYLLAVDHMTTEFVRRVFEVSPQTLLIVFGDHGLRDMPDQARGEALHVPIVVLGPNVRQGVDSAALAVSDIWPRIIAPLAQSLGRPPLAAPLASGAIVSEALGSPRFAAILGGSLCRFDRPGTARCGRLTSGKPPGDDGRWAAPNAVQARALSEVVTALRARDAW